MFPVSSLISTPMLSVSYTVLKQEICLLKFLMAMRIYARFACINKHSHAVHDSVCNVHSCLLIVYKCSGLHVINNQLLSLICRMVQLHCTSLVRITTLPLLNNFCRVVPVWTCRKR